MLYKPLAFRTENSTFSRLFNIVKGERGRSRQGVPRLLTNPAARVRNCCSRHHRRPKLTIREIDRINDLCKRMNDLCKRMSDLCKRIEWDVTT